MAFIRVKKRIKGEKIYYFAYEVENKWYKRKKATRQRIKRYLGRVFKLRPIEPLHRDFMKYLGVDETGFIEYLERVRIGEMMLDLVEYTLINNGFVQGVGRQKNRLILGDFIYDILRHKLYSFKTARPVVLEINEGYMCDLSIRQMLRFNPNRFEDNRVLGKEFAKIILAAGILIKPEIFVELFDKLQKENV